MLVKSVYHVLMKLCPSILFLVPYQSDIGEPYWPFPISRAAIRPGQSWWRCAMHGDACQAEVLFARQSYHGGCHSCQTEVAVLANFWGSVRSIWRVAWLMKHKSKLSNTREPLVLIWPVLSCGVCHYPWSCTTVWIQNLAWQYSSSSRGGTKHVASLSLIACTQAILEIKCTCRETVFSSALQPW